MNDIPLAEEYIQCRTFGHQWDEFNPIDMRRPSFGWRFSLRCLRCETERHDLINKTGSVLSREYRYPDEYAIAEKISRPRFRLELWRRKKRRMREAS